MKQKAHGIKNRDGYGYSFIAPFLIVFMIFSIYPVVRTLFLSFTNYTGFNDYAVTGLTNYKRVFGDILFRKALVNTVKIWGVNIVVQLGIAFLLTMVFSDMKYRMRGLGVFRALFYLPNLIAATSVAFLFRWLLDWKYGSVNQVLLNLHITSDHIDYWGHAVSAQVAVGVIGAWMWFGNSFIMLMAGVLGVNSDYFEAAAIDGAGRWKVFTKITLPLLKPIMLYVAITSLIGGLQIFDIPFLVAPEGQPNNALLTVVAYLYKMAFKYNQIGYAGAIAFILFFIIAICSVIIYFAMYSKKEEN